MKLDIYQFNLLPEDEKAQLVWDQGVFLTNRVERKNGINLYWLSKFYVEVWYNQQSKKITKICSFKIPKVVEPYLKEIKLNINQYSKKGYI